MIKEPTDTRKGNTERTVSFFEFWPTWLMYLPVVAQWLVLAIRYRSLTLPLLANPVIPLSGMVGGSKNELMAHATGECLDTILPWVCYTTTAEKTEQQAEALLALCHGANLSLPLVCKPDVGCRGVGVKLVRNEDELHTAIASYPSGVGIVCQKLSQYEPEVGIFYVREPSQPEGNIVSLAFKQTPYVIGDGVRTLAKLVADEQPRVLELFNLYESRNENDWDRVLESGERHRLLFAASHSQGAVFSDAREHITPALVARLNRVMSGLPNFHYGRLDVKFKDIESLHAGETLEIVEINGASSESIHIWDKDAHLLDAIRTLLWQYRTLFRIGHWQRRQGLKTPGLKVFIQHWLRERALTRVYPETD